MPVTGYDPRLRPAQPRTPAADAFAINAESRIVGWSERSTGKRYATLWQPGSGDETPPPPVKTKTAPSKSAGNRGNNGDRGFVPPEPRSDQ